MEKHMYTKERFVVFLDIMGFKDRVARNSATTLYDELTEFNSKIIEILDSVRGFEREIPEQKEGSSEGLPIGEGGREKNIMIAQFSDSIVLFSPDNSPNSLSMISEVAKRIIKEAIQREKPIPLKGAIAEGTITCDMQKQLFFGQSLIDAFLLEENVQYYGIVVHHTAEQSVIELQSEMYRNISVPLKSGSIEHYELAWYKDCMDDVRNWLGRLRLSVSDSPRKYIDNTNSMLSK